MSMSPPGYDAEADFAATGRVLCDDCGYRVTPRTLETLPEHLCATIQRINRELLEQVAEGAVFRNARGDVHVEQTLGSRATANAVNYDALVRLTLADLVTLRETGEREPRYVLTDRAAQGA